MKSITITIASLATVLSFSACDPKIRPRQRTAPGPKPVEVIPAAPPDDGSQSEQREIKKPDEGVDPAPAKREKIPPPPKPSAPDYGIKVPEKPGYVKSPYDGEHRLIDVRGLPPGTEAECPYTRKTFLVPP